MTRQKVASSEHVDHLDPNSSGPRLLDVRRAADYLGVGERYIRRLVDEKRIHFYKFGPARSSPLRFDPARLDAWLEEQSVEPERQGSPTTWQGVS